MHTWRLGQVDQVLHWAENRQLTAAQVARVEALAALAPSRAAWAQAAERFCTVAGALLLTAAVVFFFAYNWDEMARYAKFGLAAGALLACVAVALASRPAGLAWQSALFGAAVCTGALLALIGQTYQTGADIWELFAAWTALMLPFVLLARAWPAWLLCMAVSNLWGGRMLEQDGTLWQIGAIDPAVKLALWCLLNVLWWLAAWRGGRWMLSAPTRLLERVGAALVLTGLTMGAVVGLWAGESWAAKRMGGFVVYVPVFMLVAGAGFWYYRQRRLDIVMLGILGVASVTLGVSVLIRILVASGDAMVFSMFVVAAFVMVASGYLLGWLRGLYRQQNQSARGATPGVESGVETSQEPRA